MLAKTVLSLGLWLQFAAGQNAPERGPQRSASNSEGDLLFLLDSSGSVSYYEFIRVKEFMWDLVRPFTFGPKDVQTGIIHISTMPTMEFPFDQYQSSETLQQAIRDTQQLMGDTNTGKALSYAKEKFFSDEAGARPDVPKVLVWVTDGFSTDDISEPMQLLKDMGVTVFIVSTGRSNYLELSAAASQPPEKHLHFVDVDDLPIITEELRDAILGAQRSFVKSFSLTSLHLLPRNEVFHACISNTMVLGYPVVVVSDVIQANRLHAVDITSSSFRLMWPKLLSQETGYYTLEYAPTDDLARKRTKQVSGADTSLTLSNLVPETTYEVALIPESNVHYFPPQTTRVTTLAEEISPVQVLISESGPHSFHVSWAPTLDSVVGYQILYGPLPGNSVKLLEVDGQHNSTVVENLAPNTTYLVTVTAVYKSGMEKSLSAKACTQEEGSKVRHLRFEDMGPNTLKASWDAADGKVLGYRVRCRRQTGPSSVISVSPQIHSVLLTDLASGTTNKVCVKPMYKSQPGKGLCRMVRMQPATEAQVYKHRQRA